MSVPSPNKERKISMNKIAYKFLPQEYIDNQYDPILIVLTAPDFQDFARDVFGDDRELSDLELNRIAQYDFDDYVVGVGGQTSSCLNNFILSLLKEVLSKKDSEWEKIDNEFKARQEALL